MKAFTLVQVLISLSGAVSVRVAALYEYVARSCE